MRLHLLCLYACGSWVDMGWWVEELVSSRVRRSFSFFPSLLGHVLLCVRADFKWLNRLVVFAWGADTVAWHIFHNIFVCSESDFVQSHTPQNLYYLSFRPKAAFLPSSPASKSFVSTSFQAGVGRSAQVEKEGFALFTTQDTEEVEWSFYYDYLVLMLEGSQNRHQNLINRPALLWCHACCS